MQLPTTAPVQRRSTVFEQHVCTRVGFKAGRGASHLAAQSRRHMQINGNQDISPGSPVKSVGPSRHWLQVDVIRRRCSPGVGVPHLRARGRLLVVPASQRGPVSSFALFGFPDSPEVEMSEFGFDASTDLAERNIVPKTCGCCPPVFGGGPPFASLSDQVIRRAKSWTFLARPCQRSFFVASTLLERGGCRQVSLSRR